MEGWIKLHRKILEWEWYDDINTKVLFLHLLLTANHEDKKWRGIEIKKGQKLTSRTHLSEETGLTEQQIRTSLNKLKSTGEITIETTNKNTLVTIEKYGDYQIDKKELTNRATSKLTNKQPTSNQQVTTNKNNKNNKNIYYGEYKNVFLSDEQYEKLKSEYPNDYNKRIQNLDDYMQSSGKKYKDCLATIRNWSRKDKKEEKVIDYTGMTREEVIRRYCS